MHKLHILIQSVIHQTVLYDNLSAVISEQLSTKNVTNLTLYFSSTESLQRLQIYN